MAKRSKGAPWRCLFAAPPATPLVSVRMGRGAQSASILRGKGSGSLLLGLAVWVALVTIVTPGRSASEDEATAEPVRILERARAALDRSDPEAAADALLALRQSQIADHALLLRARLLRDGGDLAGAITAATEALAHAPPSEVRARIELERGRAQLSSGDLLEAYRAFRSASEVTRRSDLAAESLVELAAAFTAGGLPGDALLLYREVWREWPVGEQGDLAYARARTIAQATAAAPLPAAEYLARADRLRSSYRCEQGIEIYEFALADLELDEEARERALRGQAECLFQRRRYEEAAEAFSALVKSHPADVGLEIKAARSLARHGQRSRAAKRFEAIAKKTRGATREHARYLLAIIFRTEKPKTYEKIMRSIERQRSSPRLAHRARWRLAWVAVQNGNDDEAARFLRRLARGPLTDIEVQRAHYWLALAQEKKDPTKREEGLHELVREVPLSYYGFLAASRLGIEPELERSFVGTRTRTGEDASTVRARILLRGGFPEAAGDELESRLRAGRLNREQRLAAARILHEIGDHFRAVRVVVDGFGGALEQGIDPEWAEAWTLAWPRPFHSDVDRAVTEFGFDPALVYAVMREESTYRPKVESPVGARGLMQIIPTTGDRIARALGANPYTADHLFQPATNVRFGTWYLKDLLRRFGGEQPLAIAAYNAGPEAVNGWVPDDEPLIADDFIESVPYGETRRYLRKVLTSYEIYKLLYRTGESNGDREKGWRSAQPAASNRR